MWNSKDTQLTGSSLSSVHWAKWDSSGNIQTLKGTTIKTLTTTMASSTVYTTKAAISSDDEFIYIGGSFGSPFRPFVAKLPTDGSGTDNSTALSGNFPGDDLFTKITGSILTQRGMQMLAAACPQALAVFLLTLVNLRMLLFKLTLEFIWMRLVNVGPCLR